MTDREAFEAWHKSFITKQRGDATHWDAWQAATAAERERCAKVVGRQARSPKNKACPSAVDGWWPDQVTYRCAAAIRGTK